MRDGPDNDTLKTIRASILSIILGTKRAQNRKQVLIIIVIVMFMLCSPELMNQHSPSLVMGWLYSISLHITLFISHVSNDVADIDSSIKHTGTLSK